MIMKGSYDMKRIVLAWKKSSLIKRIAIGIALGAVLGLTFPKLSAIGLLGFSRSASELPFPSTHHTHSVKDQDYTTRWDWASPQ